MRSINILISILIGGLMSFFALSSAQAVEWKLQYFETLQPVTKILQSSPPRILIKTGSRWHRAEWCGRKLCLKPAKNPHIKRPPAGGLTDGGVAVHKAPGIVSAWYSQPTRRYDHGILGDDIEGGSLMVKDHTGNLHTYRLAANSVFEDLTPRLVDLDGDGRAEVITIRSFLDAGASLAVFGLRGGKLKLIASTPPIGLSHRWLNIAGIKDLNRNGTIDIAIVVTPHIGGTLEIWSYTGGKLVKTASKYGFSNHFIGSRNQGLSATGDVNNDGIPEIAIPDAAQRKLRIMALVGKRLEEVDSINLPGKIAENIGTLRHPTNGSSAYLLGLSNGKLIAAITH